MPGLSQDASFATALSGGALLALWLGFGLATGRLQLPSFFAPSEHDNDKKIKVVFRFELKIIATKGCSRLCRTKLACCLEEAHTHWRRGRIWRRGELLVSRSLSPSSTWRVSQKLVRGQVWASFLLLQPSWPACWVPASRWLAHPEVAFYFQSYKAIFYWQIFQGWIEFLQFPLLLRHINQSEHTGGPLGSRKAFSEEWSRITYFDLIDSWPINIFRKNYCRVGGRVKGRLHQKPSGCIS